MSVARASLDMLPCPCSPTPQPFSALVLGRGAFQASFACGCSFGTAQALCADLGGYVDFDQEGRRRAEASRQFVRWFCPRYSFAKGLQWPDHVLPTRSAVCCVAPLVRPNISPVCWCRRLRLIERSYAGLDAPAQLQDSRFEAHDHPASSAPQLSSLSVS